MVHQLAEDHAVGQGLSQVVRKRHFQLRLDGLKKVEMRKEGGCRGGESREEASTASGCGGPYPVKMEASFLRISCLRPDSYKTWA